MAVAFYAATFVALVFFCYVMKLDTLCRAAFLLCKHEFWGTQKKGGKLFPKRKLISNYREWARELQLVVLMGWKSILQRARVAGTEKKDRGSVLSGA